jgi:probable HAF family extracellular repeat protein
MVGLGSLGGALNFSDATGVSANGAVVVGTSYGASGIEAFRWTADDGMVGLGDLPGGVSSSSALAISADGRVIVGRSSSSAANNEAFRWTAEDGLVDLGHLPNVLASSIAYATSGNGGVVVGGSNTLTGEAAFLWTAETGMVDLEGYLVSKGVTGLDHWILTRATGISNDGRTIVGWGENGLNSEGWIATIPEPSSLGLAALGIVSLLGWKSWRKR